MFWTVYYWLFLIHRHTSLDYQVPAKHGWRFPNPQPFRTTQQNAAVFHCVRTQVVLARRFFQESVLRLNICQRGHNKSLLAPARIHCHPPCSKRAIRSGTRDIMNDLLGRGISHWHTTSSLLWLGHWFLPLCVSCLSAFQKKYRSLGLRWVLLHAFALRPRVGNYSGLLSRLDFCNNSA